MDANLTAIFNEARDPTHATLDEVLAQLLPILSVTSDVQKQIAEHRQKILTAELAPDTAHMDGDFERLHQTLDALETDVKSLMDAGRRVKLSIMQYERYAGEIETQEVARLDKSAADAAPVVAPGPVV